jgi:hypothetical protein
MEVNMCPRLFIIFIHNKKYSRQQNGLVEKNKYMLVENVQSFKCVMKFSLFYIQPCNS